MIRWRKTGVKYLAGCLAALMLVTVFPAGGWAAQAPPVSLEQAVRIVKENLEIPQQFTTFTSGFETSDERQVWSLTWASREPGEGDFSARVDAATGEVVAMNLWMPQKDRGQEARLPAVSPVEALQTAEELVSRLAASHWSELQPVPDDQVIPLTGGQVSYTFRWQRLVNGIPFLGDGVTVEVSGRDGRVVDYNLAWTRTDFPAAAGVISPEAARQAFDQAGMLELQYFQPSRIRPLAAGESPQPPVILVYRLHHLSQGVIDALSGEPLVPEAGQWFADQGALGGMEGMEEKAPGSAAFSEPAPLTPEELEEISTAAGLIGQDAAVAAVKKWVEIPAGLTLKGASLVTDWASPDRRLWNLHWNNGQAGAGELRYVSARVDATSGEVMSFDLAYEDAGRKSGQMDREAAQELVEEFLRQIRPQRFQEVELDTQYNPGWMPEELQEGENPPTQHFNYRRMVNGIPFPANNIDVTIDAVTGIITHYDVSWSGPEFPEPDGLLEREQVTDAFLKNQPLTLTYVRLYNPSGSEEVRLVYSPVTLPGTAAAGMVDARTGQYLGGQGKPVAQPPQAYSFTDIQGNFAEKEISLLGRAGIFGEYGKAFHPNEKVTLVSLLRAMLGADNGPWANAGLSDQEILKRAKDQGWLPEDLAPGANVSREDLAKLLIRMLELERAAQIEGIYQVPYTDADALAPGSLGYVALAWGMGIMKGDGTTFDGQQAVTRAEAATALVRALEVRP